MKANTNRHKPNAYSSYRAIHENVIWQFRNRGFIDTDSLKFKFSSCGVRLNGEISCLGEILITVDKFIAIVGVIHNDYMVQTQWYTYNVSVQNYGNHLRYDNQDYDCLRPNHFDEHHKHIFNWQTGWEEPKSPIWIGLAGWPTLGDVIQEMETWYWPNRYSLPNPDRYAVLGKRVAPPSLEL